VYCIILYTPTMSNLSSPELPPLGLLAPLGDEDRRLLSSYGEFLPVQKEDKLIEEGQAQNALYIVISGGLHATILRGGHPVLLGRIGRGESIGEINVLDPAVASASVTAVEFSQIWRISCESLEEYMNAYPLPAAHLLIGIGKTLARRLRDVNEKVARLYSM
jgi:CRP/FNR family transcriptional regulator, cyclic AMP receptor protein